MAVIRPQVSEYASMRVARTQRVGVGLRYSGSLFLSGREVKARAYKKPGIKTFGVYSFFPLM